MRHFACLIALLFCGACTAAGPWVELNGQRFSVEVVRTPEKQALGLMYRDELPENHGMLFVFPSEGRRSFWMKNTRIPLDILYFDADLRLVSVSADTPPCRTARCPSYPSEGPAQYVLELNAGQGEALGLKTGDHLILHIDQAP
jgi:uncharacterized membrane protein (UPF0127 family)